MKAKFEHVRIAGMSCAVPAGKIDIEDEVSYYGDAALLRRNQMILGLGSRHVVDAFTAFSDLAAAAAERLLSELGTERSAIDAVIVASTSHDYRKPATACLLHDRLGLSQDCACYDQSGLGCTAFVYALCQAHALVESGATGTVLLVAGDLSSTHSDRRNRNVNMLFGDAAVAALVVRDETASASWFVLGTDGSGWDRIIAPAGGQALPVLADIAGKEVVDSSGNVWHFQDDILKGLDVYRFSTEFGPRSVAAVLAAAGATISDADYCAIHQANAQIVRAVADYAGIPPEKYSVETFRAYGNCGAASVAMDAVREGLVRPLGRTMLVSFGVGLSWATAWVDFARTRFCEMVEYVTAPERKVPREQALERWERHFKGE